MLPVVRSAEAKPSSTCRLERCQRRPAPPPYSAFAAPENTWVHALIQGLTARAGRGSALASLWACSGSVARVSELRRPSRRAPSEAAGAPRFGGGLLDPVGRSELVGPRGSAGMALAPSSFFSGAAVV